MNDGTSMWHDRTPFPKQNNIQSTIPEDCSYVVSFVTMRLNVLTNFNHAFSSIYIIYS